MALMPYRPLLDYRGQQPPGRYTWQGVVGVMLLVVGLPLAGCYGYTGLSVLVMSLTQPPVEWRDVGVFALIASAGAAAATAGYLFLRSTRRQQ
jgi:hypothetical protein